jgi:hypothetical protein
MFGVPWRLSLYLALDYSAEVRMLEFFAAELLFDPEKLEVAAGH